MTRRMQRSPQRAVRLLCVLGIQGEDLRDVRRATLHVRAVLKKIKDANRNHDQG